MITLGDTYQQTKRLVNAATGTYQTVLTITESVGQNGFAGLYDCKVGNTRGESSMQTIIAGNGKLIQYIIWMMSHLFIT